MSATEIGVISDTHGLLRPEAIDALRGVDAILHAGDIGSASILEALGAIAPVTAVRGNVDREPWCSTLPWTAEVHFGDLWIHMRHIREELDMDLTAARFSVFVFGHTHQPWIEQRGAVLWLNPGSAGPRRFRQPITLARLTIQNDRAQARHITLVS